jgi:hypothetical protein
MDVRLYLAKTPTIHDLLVGRLRMWLPPPAPHPCAAGVLLGVFGDLGVSMPWGYQLPACHVSPTSTRPRPAFWALTY